MVGENPAVGSANGKMQRLGLANLDWLVVRDLQMIETATFWKDGPEIETGELVTEEIGTEVFFLPAATHVEKAGTFTQTQRMLQWRDKAVEPPGDCRSELDFYFELGSRIRAKLAGSTDEMDRPLLDLAWDYPTGRAAASPTPQAVLREINGTGPDGAALSAYTELKDDGSTACGCWIYCGVYADEVNQARRRKPHWEQDQVAAEWGWAWPANRRILYNRASADPDGTPWSERKKYVWWDAEAGKWTGADVPDFIPDRAPDHVPEPKAPRARTRSAASDPFIMQTDGKAWLFAPLGVADGPMPTHYEPPESPVAQPALRAAEQPGSRTPTRPGRTRSTPSLERGLPVRVHHLPADRAPHGGRDEPDPALPGRAAAGAVLRGVAAAGARARAGERRLGHDRHRPYGDRGAGAGHRPAAVAAAGRPVRRAGRAALPLGPNGHHARRLGQRPGQRDDGPQRLHPGQGRHLRHPAGPASARRRPSRRTSRTTVGAPGSTSGRDPDGRRSGHDEQLAVRAARRRRPATPATTDHPPRMGFFTDTSVCIGCKACEVACKEWNEVPDDGYLLTGMSYDNTQELGASTWRHVAFIEKPVAPDDHRPGTARHGPAPGLGMARRAAAARRVTRPRSPVTAGCAG